MYVLAMRMSIAWRDRRNRAAAARPLARTRDTAAGTDTRHGTDMDTGHGTDMDTRHGTGMDTGLGTGTVHFGRAGAGRT